jgi:Ca-activated chloride channel family protein
VSGARWRLAAIALALSIFCGIPSGFARDFERTPCTEDAMIVFDASGSMSSTWGAHAARRIDMVRDALGRILPSVTSFRRIGLMTYGPAQDPGLFNQCDNVDLIFLPVPNAATRIMASVQRLMPAGGTPLTRAVEQGAEALDFRTKPGVIVVLTDGEDTCGGSPCHVARALHAIAEQLTIHVIGLDVKGASSTDAGSMAKAQCFADYNGGLYLAPETAEDLIAALQRTLGCPMMSEEGVH